jgi:hypothetical protein
MAQNFIKVTITLFSNALRSFSLNYAAGISACISAIALFIGVVTLLYLRGEFTRKYQPYVNATPVIVRIGEEKRFQIDLVPRNVGSYPCEVRIVKSDLQVGDEVYENPDLKDWVLLPPYVSGTEIRVPFGHINPLGIQKIREARYKVNRVEVHFTLLARSLDKGFSNEKRFGYEIDVLTDTPFVRLMLE